MKKISVIFILAVVLSLATILIASATFVDVPKDAYYADAAQRMAEREILSGYGDNYYYGNHSVTRAQVAALVCKMLGKTDEAAALAGPTEFDDVPKTSWATGYVNYAVANGIINGDGDGNFRPDDNVKYEEVVKVVVCVLGLDKDVKIDPSDWSKEYIEAAEKAGLTENLIGKKGEFMLRSDIAVICDAAMAVIDEKAEETTIETTKKSTSGKTPSSGKTEKPADTTTAESSSTATEYTMSIDENGFPVGPNDGEWD